jgi:catechol 2,3-dioxygenase-like lactoylglutathione lyase family enzyme
MEQRLSLVTIGVRDLERSLSFYEALGWRRGNSHAEVAFFQLNGVILSLFSRESLAADATVAAAGQGFSGIVLAYNARNRAEVDTVLEEVRRAGGQIVKEAHDAFWGGYSGYFADPDGHLWEVAWNPEWEISAAGDVRLPYRSE